jgi:hypothetical protein
VLQHQQKGHVMVCINAAFLRTLQVMKCSVKCFSPKNLSTNHCNLEIAVNTNQDRCYVF